MEFKMKKLLLSMAALGCSVFTFANEYTTMSPIMEKGEEIVEFLENSQDQEIVRMEYDILTSTTSSYRTLTNNWTYTIVAFGDFRFQDIDVNVYRKVNGTWKPVTSDSDESSMAVVTVSPNTTGEYRIDITAYSFKDGYSAGHYGLIICHDQPD